MNIFTFILLISTISCSSIKTINSRNSLNHNYASVLNEESEQKHHTKINNLIEKNNSFGPNIVSGETFQRDNEDSPNIISIYFGPALYRGIKYIDLLKLFEERKIEAHILSGIGMGAILATLFARGDTPELIEWKLYKLYSRLSKHIPFESTWIDLVNKFIDKEFKNLKIQNLKKTLILCLYNNKSKRNNYYKKGSIAKLLKRNFHLFSHNNSMEEISPIISNVNFNELIKKSGADKTFILNVIGKDVSFIKPTDFVFGVYSKIPGYIDSLSTNLPVNTFGIRFPDDLLELDSYKSSSGSRNFLFKKISDIINFTKSKKESQILGLEHE